ncbi:formin-like protein 6 [Zingiber officinale]|uniref:formin-like protein 6 n=1 Tax=Zingiber officinale TaxID=94328 RepID=UPI001C4D23E0|nr:formin-like protein 6 [Zingiber officinale]
MRIGALFTSTGRIFGVRWFNRRQPPDAGLLGCFDTGRRSRLFSPSFPPTCTSSLPTGREGLRACFCHQPREGFLPLTSNGQRHLQRPSPPFPAASAISCGQQHLLRPSPPSPVASAVSSGQRHLRRPSSPPPAAISAVPSGQRHLRLPSPPSPAASVASSVQRHLRRPSQPSPAGSTAPSGRRPPMTTTVTLWAAVVRMLSLHGRDDLISATTSSSIHPRAPLGAKFHRRQPPDAVLLGCFDAGRRPPTAPLLSLLPSGLHLITANRKRGASGLFLPPAKGGFSPTHLQRPAPPSAAVSGVPSGQRYLQWPVPPPAAISAVPSGQHCLQRSAPPPAAVSAVPGGFLRRPQRPVLPQVVSAISGGHLHHPQRPALPPAASATSGDHLRRPQRPALPPAASATSGYHLSRP